jgi:hypothetical protein
MHYERTGEWPRVLSGPIVDVPNETWSGIDHVLMRGGRSLPGNSSLARLLEEKRSVRNKQNLPPLTEEKILKWVDAHKGRTGKWPKRGAGPIPEAPGENWNAIDASLAQGVRGLPGGSSLARLLAEHRGMRNPQDLPPLTADQILAWADAHLQRTGNWPTQNSGPVNEAPGETWKAIDLALLRGSRGLSSGSSLTRLLAERRGIRNPQGLTPLTVDQILVWADARSTLTGEWPKRTSGSIHGSPGDTWSAVDVALANGARGLGGGSSLARLLAEHRNVRNRKALPPLSINRILEWADAHFHRRGEWPTIKSGSVFGVSDETWAKLSSYLTRGSRGLPGDSTLARLLAEHRGVRNPRNPPSLTVDQISAWADEHFKRAGAWPSVKSGAIEGAPGETWNGVEQALRVGRRGLPGGSSLAQLIGRHREAATS